MDIILNTQLLGCVTEVDTLKGIEKGVIKLTNATIIKSNTANVRFGIFFD